MASQLSTIEMCGLRIARIEKRELVDLVFEEFRTGRGGWVVTANVDILQRYTSSGEMRELFRAADVVVADGMPLVWAASLQRTPLPERVAGSDLVWDLAGRAAQERRSVFLLGGSGDTAERAAEQFRSRLPNIKIAGYSNPRVSLPPTLSELDSILRDLKRVRPDLIYVGLGSPKQEYVIRQIRAQLPSAWMIGVGVSFSFASGELKRAPQWMQRSGLEWLHRLGQEPSRLAARYLLRNVPFVIKLLVRQSMKRILGKSP